ncbi:GGDEF domain-containing protein [Vibrio fluvialis]|uniref:Diguanylate cyclase n=1 Tax=Vibrio fluvialis TaxID=676 RepID=A0AAX2LX17_VIBFL|nr:GGDEF domain-containing protein [Vibrio fluvialis]AMF92064.1 GGDEF domain-containing protein [Vibrio fluvialis]EKO4011049.1 GGDEF domain-containing protein [Vibrio fluvialis]MBL4286043.1 diguanylate cyclase [Vibrio fluvialis]MBL4290236.1 diguanylate cyclase [Vibrio fluvialis]MBY8163258.1 diguanylate cyclase [Vibrio fluvialis]
MNSLVGQQLKEMAKLGRLRKQKVVLISSIITALVLSLNGYLLLVDNQLVYSLFNLACAAAAIANMIYSRYRRSAHADLILTSLLLTQAMMLLAHGNIEGSKLFWVYPIVATIIFINRFQTGLFLSIGFCMLSILSIYSNRHASLGPDTMASDYFVISLISLTAICNTSAYFYSKAVRYIHLLYREGIEELAYTDQLTGLANRWSFENWATAKLAEPHPHSLITALVFLDIDNFKAINDNYGHDVGDRVLKHFAQRLKNNVRHSDRRTERHDYSIARFAGDEFVLLLYDVKSLQDLDSILHRISHLFEEPYKEGDTKLLNNLTVSAGAALFPLDADNLEELTRCADKAMYAAKHGGKNQYRYYHNVTTHHDEEAEQELAQFTPAKNQS